MAMMRKKTQGFSLLEALVALTILASASMAIFAWLNSSFQLMAKANLYSDASPVVFSAIDYIKTLDLSEQPEGVYQSADVSVRWVVTPVFTKAMRDIADGGGNFYYSLFKVEYFPEVSGQALPTLQGRVINYSLKPGANDSMLVP